MAETLVLKLKGVVNNPELLKLNEIRLRINVPSAPTNITVNLEAGAQDVSIVGNAHFTSSSISVDNLGTTARFLAGASEKYIRCLGVGDIYLSIPNKTLVTGIGGIGGGVLLVNNGGNARAYLNIDDLKYTSVNKLNVLENVTISGRTESLIGKQITSLYILAQGDFATGSDIKHLIPTSKTLQFLNILNKPNLRVALEDMANVVVPDNTYGRYVEFTNVGVHGNIINLSKITNRQIAIRNNVANEIGVYGDIGYFNDQTIFFSSNNTDASFTFSGFTGRTNILALERVKLISGVDEFLIDCAELSLSEKATLPWMRVIRIIGVRSPASDGAVAQLASKGVTVIISVI